jgi:hypothetical protein
MKTIYIIIIKVWHEKVLLIGSLAVTLKVEKDNDRNNSNFNDFFQTSPLLTSGINSRKANHSYLPQSYWIVF